MRILIQRVSEASVTIDGRVAGRIGRGVVALVGFCPTDDERIVARTIDKFVGLRIFADETGNTNLSLEEVGGGILAVSQFTLYADVRKGRRPSFSGAMAPGPARELWEKFLVALRARYSAGPVETGEFGAMMQVALVNDGPVTVWLDSADLAT